MAKYTNTYLESGQILCLEPARITSVFADKYCANIELESGTACPSYVPWLCNYVNGERGQGSYFMPEEGARCLVAYFRPINPSAGAPIDPSWVIIGFFADGDPMPAYMGKSDVPYDYSENCEKLSEGDVVAGKTRAGNKVILYDGGVTVITATDICKRVYSSLQNWIRDRCENYEFIGSGGEIRWKYDVPFWKWLTGSGTGRKYDVTKTESILSNAFYKTSNMVHKMVGALGGVVLVNITAENEIEGKAASAEMAKNIVPVPLNSTFMAQAAPPAIPMPCMQAGDMEYPSAKTLKLLLHKVISCVVGLHITKKGKINLITTDSANLTTGKSTNVFAAEDVNLLANGSVRIAGAAGPIGHDACIYIRKSAAGGMIHTYVLGAGQGLEAIGERIVSGDKYTIVDVGNIKQQITGAGTITQLVGEGGWIGQQILGAGAITRSCTAGVIVDFCPSGIFLNCMPPPPVFPLPAAAAMPLG